jgi:hypothetical protein
VIKDHIKEKLKKEVKLWPLYIIAAIVATICTYFFINSIKEAPQATYAPQMKPSQSQVV